APASTGVRRSSATGPDRVTTCRSFTTITSRNPKHRDRHSPAATSGRPGDRNKGHKNGRVRNPPFRNALFPRSRGGGSTLVDLPRDRETAAPPRPLSGPAPSPAVASPPRGPPGGLPGSTALRGRRGRMDARRRTGALRAVEPPHRGAPGAPVQDQRRPVPAPPPAGHRTPGSGQVRPGRPDRPGAQPGTGAAL